MDPNKIGKFILSLRKDNNLTQAEFASMFGVTYQAVSKWETGKNIPDIAILKSICNKFNIDINDLLDGEKTKKNTRRNTILFLAFIAILITGVTLAYILKNDSDFNFKTLSSNCGNFNINGSIAFNKNKSHIYISGIEYCGGNDTNIYEKIECILYESHGENQRKIDSKVSNTRMKLEDFLKDVSFYVEDYSAACTEFHQSNIFLQIYATDSNKHVTSYKIPLNLEKSCASN